MPSRERSAQVGKNPCGSPNHAKAAAAERAVKAAQQVYEEVVKEARVKIRKRRMSCMR